MSEIENVLSGFGEQLVNSLKSSLQSSKPDAETLAESIEYTLQATDSGFNFQLLINDYYNWVDKGRLPGRFPPPQAIIRWANNKGLVFSDKRIKPGKGKTLPAEAQTKSLAYLIGREIAVNGIPPTGFYSSIVNNELLDQLKNELSEALKQDCLNQLMKK